MMKYRLLSLLNLVLSPLLISSCSDQKIKHDLRVFQREKVSLSLQFEAVTGRNIGHEALEDGTVSMVMYYDSTECSQCRISHLADCLPLYELADSIGVFRVVTIFAPRQEEYNELMASLMKLDFPYPLYVDFDGSFCKANPGIPEDRRFHSFLLDRDGHPVFVGDPVASGTMWSLFEKALARIKE